MADPPKVQEQLAPRDDSPQRATAANVGTSRDAGVTFGGPLAQAQDVAVNPGQTAFNNFQVGGVVRGRGRRARPEAWQPHLRTGARYEQAAAGLGRAGGNIEALGRNQMMAAAQGIRRIAEDRSQGEERYAQRRQEMERGWGDYLGAVRQVEEAAELDPGRVWARTDTPSRIMAGIAMGGQIAARAFGRPMERGPIEHFHALIRQDLDLQQNEYERGVGRARARQGVYNTMRQRFQDERVAMDMSEAAQWRQVQRQIGAYGNQIQNEQLRGRLGVMAAQAGAQADQAALRGLQARSREQSASRGSLMRQITMTDPSGRQHTTLVPERQFGQDVRTMMRNEAQMRGRAQQAMSVQGARGSQLRQRLSGGLLSRQGGAAVTGARNIIETQRLFREGVENAVRQNGGSPRDVELAGINPMRVLAGEGRLRDYFQTWLVDNDQGQALAQRMNQAIFDAIKQQSGAQFTDVERIARRAIGHGHTGTPEQIMTGMGIIGEMMVGNLDMARGLDPEFYRTTLANMGIENDPIQQVRDNQAALRDLMGTSSRGNWIDGLVNLAEQWQPAEGDDAISADAWDAVRGEMHENSRQDRRSAAASRARGDDMLDFGDDGTSYAGSED